MARPLARRPFQGRVSKRSTQWELGPGGDDIATFDVTGISASSAVIIGSGVQPTGEELTITRTRGLLSLQLVVGATVSVGFNVAVGIGVASVPAFTAGAPSVPMPFGEVNWQGWLWHSFFWVGVGIGGGTGGDSEIVNVMIDSKAQRKLRLNDVMYAAVEVGEVGTASLDVRLVTRVLFKLA